MTNVVLEVAESSFEQEVARASVPVVVDFYAPWCGPCKMLGPVLEQLARDFRGRLTFIKVNVDQSASLASRYNITGVPTLVLFRDGTPVDSIVGLVPPKALRDWLERAGAGATSTLVTAARG